MGYLFQCSINFISSTMVKDKLMNNWNQCKVDVELMDYSLECIVNEELMDHPQTSVSP